MTETTSPIRAPGSSAGWLGRLEGKISWIVLGLEDGKRQRLPVEMGREAELLDLVAPLAPHATFGFSPENEARFRSAPASMRVR